MRASAKKERKCREHQEGVMGLKRVLTKNQAISCSHSPSTSVLYPGVGGHPIVSEAGLATRSDGKLHSGVARRSPYIFSNPHHACLPGNQRLLGPARPLRNSKDIEEVMTFTQAFIKEWPFYPSWTLCCNYEQKISWPWPIIFRMSVLELATARWPGPIVAPSC